MKPTVVMRPPRASASAVERLAALGAATVHEAMGRRGCLGPSLRPIYAGARIAGNAVTVSAAPGDNLMAHVAAELAGVGDIIVLAPTSPSTDGYFGEVLARGLQHRGVRAIVTATGIRDVAELTAMGFPAWSTAICAQGTVKATPGSVNVSVVIGGIVIQAGDVIVADDDGVVCVPRTEAEEVAAAGERRVAYEEQIMAGLARGEVGLDLFKLRPLVQSLGIEYVQYAADRH